MSTEESKEVLLDFVQTDIENPTTEMLSMSNWKRTAKRHAAPDCWERDFTNKKIPNSKIVIAERDGDVFVVACENIGPLKNPLHLEEMNIWWKADCASNPSEYYFAMSSWNTDCTAVYVLPKVVYDRYQYIWDQELNGEIGELLLENTFYELHESVYSTNMNVVDARAKLISLGFVENPDIANYSGDDHSCRSFYRNGIWNPPV